jgi:hypothetical protein
LIFMAIPPQLKKIRKKSNENPSVEAVDVARRIVLGDAGKEAGIGAALRNADEAWVTAALASVFRVASEREHFTVDHVWMHGDGLPTPREPRAMGSVMRVASKAGWVSPTPDHWMSKRPVCHRRPLRVWQSNLLGIQNKKGDVK